MDADPDPDPTFHPDANVDLYPDPDFQIKPQTLEIGLNKAHIPNILACHLQIDADPDPVSHPAYHFDAGPGYHADPDLDPQHCFH